MTIRQMDNVLIVVDDLEAAKAFFVELGMELEGETTVEGPSVDRLIGLQNVRATLALMRTPDGHGRIELDKFHTPEAIRTGPENAPVNALGIRRIMLTVDDIDDVSVGCCEAAGTPESEEMTAGVAEETWWLNRGFIAAKSGPAWLPGCSELCLPAFLLYPSGVLAARKPDRLPVQALEG